MQFRWVFPQEVQPALISILLAQHQFVQRYDAGLVSWREEAVLLMGRFLQKEYAIGQNDQNDRLHLKSCVRHQCANAFESANGFYKENVIFSLCPLCVCVSAGQSGTPLAYFSFRFELITSDFWNFLSMYITVDLASMRR